MTVDPIEKIFVPPLKVPPAGGARDLAQFDTPILEELQRRYTRRLEITQGRDAEALSKAQAVGYELGLRIVLNEIAKDAAALMKERAARRRSL